jgi:uncharacterized membrane protein YidH (DUF202 family)
MPTACRLSQTLDMTERTALALACFGFVVGMLGYSIRRHFPRVAMFFLGVMFFGLGLWMAVSTLELANKGQAHTFSRHNSTFSVIADPVAFLRSYWFHLTLGGVLLVCGAAGLILPFIRHGRRISSD